MRARLFVPIGEHPVDHLLEGEATIGRGRGATVVVDLPLLSSSHARVAWDAGLGCYCLEDLGSTNGTRLDGVPVRGRVPLGHLHVLTLADSFELVFQDLEACAARHPARAAALPGGEVPVEERTTIEPLPLPLPDVLRAGAEPGAPRGEGTTILERLELGLPSFLRRPRPAAGDPRPPAPHEPPAADRVATGGHRPGSGTVRVTPALRPPRPAFPTTPAPTTLELEREGPRPATAAPRLDLEAGPETPEGGFYLVARGESGPLRYPLSPGENLVGRGDDSAIQILSSEVSRRHAMLELRQGRLFVRDLGSRNKTFVDDEKISGEVELTAGKRLRLGAFALEVRIARGGPQTRREGER